MALDAELQIDDSVVIDISVSATPTPATGITLGRRGFPKGATFVIHIEETSADNAIDPVTFDLEYTVDDGTTWNRISTIKITGDGSMQGPRRIFSVPIGMVDFRDEIQGNDDLRVRVRVTLTATGGADDFTYSAYLAGPNPYQVTNAL